MSSVRIESAAFGDLRYVRLASLCGLADADHALIKMARLWRQCTILKRYTLTLDDVVAVLGSEGPRAVVAAQLGEMVSGGIRIRGTRGRIEWLEKLRNNGKKGGRPSKTKRKPSGFQEPNPLTLTLSPSLAPALVPVPTIPEGEVGGLQGGSVQDRPAAPKQAKARRAKPGDLTADELAIATRVLGRISERTGVAYTGSQAHLALIARQLRSGVSERELRAVIAYCWVERDWEHDPKMRHYLCPETLFGPTSIHRYLPGARAYAARHYPETPAAIAPAQPAPIAADLFARHEESR